MLNIMNDLPPHVLGVRATGTVSKQDFEETLRPALEEINKRTGKINCLFLLETTVGNFTIGAWIDDLKVGLKYFTHWNRIAVVTDEKLVEKFSGLFGLILPGESKGFTLNALGAAKKWVSAA